MYACDICIKCMCTLVDFTLNIEHVICFLFLILVKYLLNMLNILI